MQLRKQFLPCPKNDTTSEHCSVLELYFLGSKICNIIFLILSVQEEQFLYLLFSFMMCYFGGREWNSQTDEESEGRTDGRTDGQTDRQTDT